MKTQDPSHEPPNIPVPTRIPKVTSGPIKYSLKLIEEAVASASTGIETEWRLNARPPSTTKFIRKDEEVIWSYFVSDETIRKTVQSEQKSRIAFVFVLVGLILLVTFRMRLFESPGDLSSLHWILNTACILVIAGLLWALWLAIQHLRKPNPDHDRRFYAITDQRILATDLFGRVLDEMKAADIEFIIDLKSDKELLISRVGDEESTNGFFFHLLNDRDGAISAIELLKPKGLAP